MARRSTTNTPRPVSDIVRSGDAASLAVRAGKLAELGARLSRVLPPALSAQIRFANLRNGKLVFFATSPAWATRLRYSQALLLEAARVLGVKADGLVVKVAPAVPAEAERPSSEPLSSTAAKHLALAAKLLS
jgi:hypothetical protein